METVAVDDVDRGLLHALQIDGRAALRDVATAVGVSENTVARRYRRLRAAGALRVVGALNGARLGYESWLIRLQAEPDAALPIATALARREDTSWIYLVSGGTDVVATVQVPSTASRDDLLLAKLPRTGRVLGLSAQAVIAGFGLPSDWGGLAWLPPERAAALRRPETDDGAEPVRLGAADRPLLAALLRDGRASHAELAAATGWSTSTVRRRIEYLRAAGVLAFQLDLPPELLGLRAQTRLWCAVAPARLAETGRRLAEHPDVAFVAATTGPTNLAAIVHCADGGALFRFLTGHLASLDGVTAVETAPVVRTVKRAGSLLDGLQP